MNINERAFPILACLEGNVLTDTINLFIARQVPDPIEQVEIRKSIRFFDNQSIKIHHISSSLHKLLLDTSKFVPVKEFLKDTPAGTGLLLLPETLYSDFTNVPEYAGADSSEYPMDAILYSWLGVNEYRKLSGSFDANDPCEELEDRALFILPVYHDGTTQATKEYEMTNFDEMYGMEYSDSEGRAWYGKVHDYVMSFLLCYHRGSASTASSAGVNPRNRIPKLTSQTHIYGKSNFIEVMQS